MRRTTLTNQRFTYFARNVLRTLVPGCVWRARLEPTLARLTQGPEQDLHHALDRVAYYNRAKSPFEVGPAADRWRWSAFKKQRNYCFDLVEHLRAFDPALRLDYRFGDDTSAPPVPTIVKARPIAGDNANSVLFKLNKVRHFRAVKDRLRFADKRDRAVWRGKGYQPHRREFLAACFENPSCDVGCTDPRHRDNAWSRPYLSIARQLESKFVISIEGNDVATNLKWIFSSNSACLMRRPRFESWFQEGTLVPDRHYILVADDYSDLGDKVRFYSRRTDLAERIVQAAQAHAAQFVDARRESAISLLVLLRYFEASGQIEPGSFGGHLRRARRQGELVSASNAVLG
jgi:hypothetical protein